MSNPGDQCPDCGGHLNPSGICPRCAFAQPEVSGTPEPPPALGAPDTSGTRIRYFGDYELLNEHPLKGGMGMVYRARQRTTGRIVALKVLPAEHLHSAERLARFRAEIDAVARLDHPHILPFWEAGEHEGQPFYTMRWVEGGSLGDQMPRWTLAHAEPALRKPREREVVVLLQTLARAVHHAHERGVLHRDLKPGNILIDHTGHAYVADFGLAKFLEADPLWIRTAQPLTQTGVGSPGYMAPEQALGGKRAITTAADVYSLGAMFYVLLAGKPTLEGEKGGRDKSRF